MRVSKRVLTAFLPCALALSLFAGCGGGGSSSAASTPVSSDGAKSSTAESAPAESAPAESTPAAETSDLKADLHFAYWDANQTPYLEQCAAEFNKTYPNIKIALEPSTWDEYWTKLEAAATGGSIADVFWLNGPNITKYVRGDILTPIDDLIAASGIDLANYPQGLVSLYNIDGKQYAIPKDFDTVGVWYNKKLFDDAGVPYPTDDWTWEDMVEKAKALTKPDGSVFGIAASYNSNQCSIYNTIPASGGAIISDDKKTSGFDRPETMKGIQLWVDLQKAGVSPTEASLEETAVNVQFESQRVAMAFNGSWYVGGLLQSDIKDQVDVVEMPSIGGKKATVIHGLGNCISKVSKNQEAAWKWVEFLAGEAANKISAETGAAIPALKGTAQVWVDKNPQFNLKSFITSSEQYSVPYPCSANTAEWQQYEADNLKRVFSLEVSVEDACAQLAQQMNEVLAAE